MGVGTSGRSFGNLYLLPFFVFPLKTGENNSELSKTSHKFPLPYVSHPNLYLCSYLPFCLAGQQHPSLSKSKRLSLSPALIPPSLLPSCLSSSNPLLIQTHHPRSSRCSSNCFYGGDGCESGGEPGESISRNLHLIRQVL